MKQFLSTYYSLEYSDVSSLCVEQKGIPEANRALFEKHPAQVTNPVTVSEFRDTLLQISQEKGKGSRDRIYNHIAALWKRCSSPQEVYFSSMWIQWFILL